MPSSLVNCLAGFETKNCGERVFNSGSRCCYCSIAVNRLACWSVGHRGPFTLPISPAVNLFFSPSNLFLATLPTQLFATTPATSQRRSFLVTQISDRRL